MRDSKRIFIPLTLDNSTKRFFSSRQIVGIAILLFAVVALQVGMFKVHDTLSIYMGNPWLILIPCDILGVYFLFFIFRKVVLQEDKMMQDYKNNQILQKIDLSFCWNISNIKNGHIYYADGTEAVIVKLTHGYLLDRPPNQEDIHRENIKAAIGALTKQGFSFIYFNREVKDSNLEPLRDTESKLAEYKGEPFYAIANEIIRHTQNTCSAVANTEQEYYLILADTFETIKKLDYAADDFLNALHGGIYANLDILDDNEIWKFIASQYGLGTLDSQTIMSKKFESAQRDLVWILEVNRKEQVSSKVDLTKSDKEPKEVLEESNDFEDWFLDDVDPDNEQDDEQPLVDKDAQQEQFDESDEDILI